MGSGFIASELASLSGNLVSLGGGHDHLTTSG